MSFIRFKCEIQTRPDLCNSKVPKDLAKSNLAQVGIEYVLGQLYNYVNTRGSNLNTNSNILKPDRLQHERSTAGVIAQQYSPSVFVSQRFHYRKKK